MKTKHTPTPWLHQKHDTLPVYEINDGPGYNRVQVALNVSESNAQFITLAANHHEELVEALTYYVDAHERHKLSMPETNENDGKTWLRTLEIAKSLLTKLKG